MKKLLEEIKSTPGVIGSCLYSVERGILASNLPPDYKPDTQKRIASSLHSIFKLDGSTRLDVNAYEIQYDEALILVKQICSAATLSVFCHSDVNIHLANMSISMLSGDLSRRLNECGKSSEPAKVEATKPTPSNRPAPEKKTTAIAVDAETVLEGELSGELSIMRKALAKGIGPVAGVALKDALKQWLENGPAQKERLKELAHILLNEIDDEASRKEFMDDIDAVL